MSKGKAMEIKDPLLVELCPTSRASCKTCSGAMTEGSIRFGRKVRSPWHDGYDIQWRHLKCSSKFVSELDQICDVEDLPWSKILEAANVFKTNINETHEKVKEFKERNIKLWTMRNELVKLSLKNLKTILTENNFNFPEKIKNPQAASLVADALLHKKLPKCPLCDTRGLSQKGNSISCCGYVDGSAKCEFKYRFFDILHPDKKIDNHEEFKEEDLQRTEDLLIPDSLSSCPVFRNFTKEVKTVKGSKRQTSKVTLDSEDESPSDVPIGTELLNMSFASIGSTAAQRVALQETVSKHGGEFINDVDASTTALLVHDDDLSKVKNTKRYQMATDYDMPILNASFIDALLARDTIYPKIKKTKLKSRSSKIKSEADDEEDQADLPKGIILRQRKYASSYRLAGGVGKKIKNVKDTLAERLEVSKSEDVISDINTEMCQIKRGEIAEDSSLLQVDRLFDHKNMTAKIYIDYTVNDAYNCTVNLTDITTGVNKFYTIQLIQVTKPTSTVESSTSEDTEHIKTETPDNDSKTADAIKSEKIESVKSEDTKEEEEDIQDSEPKTRRRSRRLLELEASKSKTPDPLPIIKKPKKSTKNTVMTTKYFVFRKYGRIGAPLTSRSHVTDKFGVKLDEAIEHFQQLFLRFTGVTWAQRFVSRGGPQNYKFVDMDTGSAVAPIDDVNVQKVLYADSKLEENLKTFMEMISDEKMMEKQMKEQSLDLQKMPLGTISKNQLSEGYGVLKEIEALLTSAQEETQTSSLKLEMKLKAATNKFYTTIPHKFDYKSVPPVIDTLKKLEDKCELMDQLTQIFEAKSLTAVVSTLHENPIDGIYDAINCSLEWIDPTSDIFEQLSKIALSTHGVTHTDFTYEVVNIFRCARHSETKDLEKDNVKLLWHGSRMSNWIGILKNGLKIAPREAPCSGYMFGKGIYFADMLTKSANYCMACDYSPFGILVLSEVALGDKPYSRIQHDCYADSHCREQECSYTMAYGQYHPKVSGREMVILNDVKDSTKTYSVPVEAGKCVKNTKYASLKKQMSDQEGELIYNEYVVYDVSRVRQRFVFQIKFNFTDSFSD